jgi:sigma-54 dependent transcriptional regulator, acetoin dehydrogenase operon transcriptional activator AcoR
MSLDTQGEVFSSMHGARGVDIEASWKRCQAAGLSRSLTAAPLVLTAEALCAARESNEWMGVAERTLEPHVSAVEDSGHVLTLFDAQGHMLRSAGDPFVLHALDDIHFFPGADWSEASAGTNGPGTALATGHAVHVVGDAHYCIAWHPWHCAAAPVRGPGGRIVGALDVSGPVRLATPRLLALAQALSAAVEQALLAQAYRWQVKVLARLGELVAQFPSDTLLALDGEGKILAVQGAKAQALLTAVKSKTRGAAAFSANQPVDGFALSARYSVFDAGLFSGEVLLFRETSNARLKQKQVSASTTRYCFEDLVGHGLCEALALARLASPTSLPVMLCGESGVGKEMFAQSIHAASPRAAAPFVAINCASFSPELLESELFGYVGGAFSGARKEGATGRFAAAHGGTLFLDEVSELPKQAQAALLRALQEKAITPVGAAESRPVDVRLVSASNQDLKRAVAQGTFRLDLLHRLNAVVIEIPPLRQRIKDLMELVTHLSSQIEVETGLRPRLSAAVWQSLESYQWPGNVRELENVLKRLALLSQLREPTTEDLPFDVLSVSGEPTTDEGRWRRVIEQSPNMSAAAAALGVNRSTLYRWLQRVGLRPARTVRDSST